jgi:hypothetical protein
MRYSHADGRSVDVKTGELIGPDPAIEQPLTKAGLLLCWVFVFRGLNFFAYCQIIFIEYHLGLRVWWAAYPVLQNRGGDDGTGADIGHFPPFAVTPEGVADFYICSLHPILCPFHYRVDPLFNPGQPLMQPRDIGT